MFTNFLLLFIKFFFVLLIENRGLGLVFVVVVVVAVVIVVVVAVVIVVVVVVVVCCCGYLNLLVFVSICSIFADTYHFNFDMMCCSLCDVVAWYILFIISIVIDFGIIYRFWFYTYLRVLLFCFVLSFFSFCEEWCYNR